MPNRRKHSSSPPNDPRFEDGLNTLFEELELSLKWDRPSLLLAVYNSDAVKTAAMKRLRTRLASLHQKTRALVVDEEHYDIPLALNDAEPADNIFVVSNLIDGGGKNYANAYRALNIRRELLIDKKVRGVFWLSDYEFILLPYFAPDFWAFRHRVIDFTNISVSANPARPAALDWERKELKSVSEKKIPQLEVVLHNLPANAETGPIRTDLLISLAGLYWAQHDFLDARQNLQAALSIATLLELHNEQYRAYAGLGIIHAALNAPTEAIRYYRQALNIFPRDTFLWQHLSESLLSLGQVKRALAAARKATEASPATASHWRQLGEVYSRMGNNTEAIAALRRAVQEDPVSFEAWMWLGDLLGREHKTREVVGCYSKAARLDRKASLPWLHLSNFYFLQGAQTRALRAIQKAISLSPENPELSYRLGQIQHDLGNYRLARTAYQQALDLDGELIAARISLAACCALMNDPVCFNRQIEYVSRRYKQLTRCERILYNAQLGRFGRALQLIKAALSQDRVSLQYFEREPILAQLRRDLRYQHLSHQRWSSAQKPIHKK